MKNNIANKLILYTILFSSVITLIITALQLYTEFQYDVKGINQKLEQIKISYKESISHSVWLLDTEQLQVILDGITELPDIVYAKVTTGDNTDIISGVIGSSEYIEFNVALNHQYNGQNINIGQFTVIASLADVYQHLLKRLWVILLSNALKTSLVALFIYFLFSKLVTRHLTRISNFIENHDPISSSKTLTLERKIDKPDEFDTVVDSINAMHARLHEQIAEINQQKQYLSLTLNSIGDAVITTDETGLVTRLNPVAEQLTGWSSKEANKQPLKRIFPIINASTGEAIANPVDKVLASGETIYLSNHTTLIARNGMEYQIADSAAPIRDKDKILGMVLVFNDVTEQYQMREALHESEQRLRQLAENLNEVIWLVSPDWKEIIYISPAYEKNWGLCSAELYNNPAIWFDSIHPDDRQQVLQQLQNNFDQTYESIDFKEYRIKKPDGGILWIKARAYPVYDTDGKLIRIAGIAEDITQRKKASETIRRTQKMDALGKLTGGIAHDFNNMLGVIMGYADLLSDMLTEQPKMQAYADKISHAGERGAKLTKRLLAFSKNQSSDLQILDINTLLKDEQHMLEKTLTARIKLILKLTEDLWQVHLDVCELEDAILNMSINAMHAIKNNGSLVIATSNKTIASVEADSLGLPPGEYIRLKITDSGCGMDEATREQIFDPFYTTKGENGTGLGLSQVYGFVNRSGGSIKVDSALLQGTQFSLYFPRYSGGNSDAETAAEQDQNDLSGMANILVVDDEPALLSLTVEILEQQGYRVFAAEHARAALAILSTQSVELVLSDIIMPDMNGYELAEIIKEKYPDSRIQLLSGFSENKTYQNADIELSQNVLQKPVSAQDLLQRVQLLLH